MYSWGVVAVNREGKIPLDRVAKVEEGNGKLCPERDGQPCWGERCGKWRLCNNVAESRFVNGFELKKETKP